MAEPATLAPSFDDSGRMTNADGARAKVARALELLLQFDDMLHEYLDSDPITLQRQIQPDGETVAIALRVSEPVPIELSLLVGEITHQMRSALDHLAYALVIAAGNVPTRRTTFPVLLAAPQNGLRIDGGVRPDALAAIESLQPYQRRDASAHPLHVLTELWNIDKHRHLHLTTLQSTNTEVFLGAPDGSSMVGGQFQTRVVGDGDVIGVFRFQDGKVDDQLELTASGSNFIALGDSGPWPSDQPVQLVLEELHRFVATIVLPRLEHLLAVT
ncbi:hypothetical protein [Phycicoccus sp. SLBN-51]|uniref:hypothetical protein n=1 Tax=Phycicoccus sp. SLBN-51 TaxID=2768447 RepID=UPI0011512B96|nr:hypothetical protein [Phycicoccus sp. SLBN-51]TQJ51841.1 hypothetical protein FBY26_3579 [Phycicoccus sp. SLBN-51]